MLRPRVGADHVVYAPPVRERRRLAAAMTVLALAASALAGTLGVGVGTAAALDGLTVESSTMYAVDPSAGVVHVTSDYTLTNTLANTNEGKPYFIAFRVPVPKQIDAARAQTETGRALTYELSPVEDRRYQIMSVTLATRLFSQQTVKLKVAYDLVGAPARDPKDGTRVNKAYAAFDAFGFGDAGKVTVRVVVPDNFSLDKVDANFGTLKRDVGFGGEVYSAVDIADPNGFDILVAVRNDLALTIFPLQVGDAIFQLHAWPDDMQWQWFVADQIKRGVPELERLVGQPWPITDSVAVNEAVTPYLFGYAGWFTIDERSIDVGERLDPNVVFHEISHAWFNRESMGERWISEGMAQVFAAQTERALGTSPTPPSAVARTTDGFTPLESWGERTDDTLQAQAEEQYGYQAAYYVLSTVADEIGPDRWRDVVGTLLNDRPIYGGTDSGALPYPGWQRMLDALQVVGGSSKAEDLFSTLVVTASSRSQLTARAAARRDYKQVRAQSRGWGVPNVLRAEMESWLFGEAATSIATIRTIFDARDRLFALGSRGAGLAATFSQDFANAHTRAELNAVADAIGEALASLTTTTTTTSTSTSTTTSTTSTTVLPTTTVLSTTSVLPATSVPVVGSTVATSPGTT